ncbi:GerAB/ArcD/ProY family transporter [Sporohalobacter salinus]|uniref:GerAB/ArcD/ProY family transporter n=1 Tax=Sporohalobacter salinus TaxID=1494606 RepID=UPI00195F8F35|nr:GerAB/ArcD/ProY family transporter [Sporohalobacter salinus]MBM7623430.1 spore germination protein KB [Sporohalobacter salinus]
MKTKISTYQTTLLLIITILATATLFLPELIIKQAKEDSWLTVILLIGFAGLISLIYTLLIKRMGTTDLITFTYQTLGKILTIPLGLNLIVYFLITSGFIIRQTSEVLIGIYMPETPLWFFILTNLLVTTAFVYHGLEVIARSFEIMFYLFLISFLIIFLMIIPEISLDFLKPVLANGIKPVLKGVYPGLPFFSELFSILILAPQMTNYKQAGKSLATAIGFIGSFLLITILATLLLFGTKLASNLTFPLLSIHRYAKLGFLERLDPLFLFYWVGGGIFKAAIFLYIGVYIGQKLLRLSTYYTLIPFALPLVFYIAFYFFQDTTEMINIITSDIPYYLFLQVFFPLILLIISLIRGIKTNEAS